MVTRFPVPSGDYTIDLDESIDTHPDVRSREREQNKTVLSTDFAAETLPHWLSYGTDTGPGGPSFDGVGDGDATTTDVVLDTGSSGGEVKTWLAGPDVDPGEFRAARLYVWGASVSNSSGGLEIGFANSEDVSSASEAFSLGAYNLATYGDVRAGGSVQNDANGYVEPFPATSTGSWGVRVFETDNNLSSGASLRWIVDGTTREAWDEGNGWPDTSNMTAYVTVKSTDGTAVTGTIDGVHLELVP
jgi:hypothetical protein